MASPTQVREGVPATQHLAHVLCLPLVHAVYSSNMVTYRIKMTYFEHTWCATSVISVLQLA